ncbi:MAG: hypothetical protein IPM01_27605 [Burkholderiaceae bacterium]|nr:hypothetical protein [Burkholderiaceae bacterium]
MGRGAVGIAQERLRAAQCPPRTGPARRPQTGTLTGASTREAKRRGPWARSMRHRAQLIELNRRYLARFGFPFIICARLNSRDAIFGNLRARLTNSRDQELQNALTQVGQIARLRLLDILAEP